MPTELRNFSKVITTKILVLLSSLIVQLLLARHLGVEGRGAYAIVFAYTNTISYLFLLGLDVSVVHFISSKKLSPSEGIVNSLVIVLFLSFTAVVVGFFLINTHLSFFEKASLTDFYLSLAQIPFMMVSMLTLNIYTAVNNFSKYSWLIIANLLAQLILLVVLVVILGFGVTGAILSTMIPTIVIVIYTVLNLNRIYQVFPLNLSKNSVRLLLKFGASYYLGQVSTILNFQGPLIFLGFVSTKGDIGIFSIAVQLTSRSMALSEAVLTVLLPSLSAKIKDRGYVVLFSFKLVLFVTLFSLGFVAFFAEEIIHILFGIQYIGATLITQVLCIAYIIRSSGKIIEPYFLSNNTPSIVAYSSVTGLLISMLTILIFWGQEGLKISMLAMLFSFVSSTIFLIITFKIEEELPFKSFLTFNNREIKTIQSFFARLK